jgi:hypothetical protein
VAGEKGRGRPLNAGGGRKRQEICLLRAPMRGTLLEIGLLLRRQAGGPQPTQPPFLQYGKGVSWRQPPLSLSPPTMQLSLSAQRLGNSLSLSLSQDHNQHRSGCHTGPSRSAAPLMWISTPAIHPHLHIIRFLVRLLGLMRAN